MAKTSSNQPFVNLSSPSESLSPFLRFPFTLLLSLMLLLPLIACSREASDPSPPPFVRGESYEPKDVIRTIRPYGSQVRFEQVSLEDGLSQSSVNDIIQDSQGLIWFATMDGLNRFDGYNIKVFKNNPADDDSLAGNNITVLYEDSQERLWVGTESSGLDLFDRSTELFSHYKTNLEESDSLSSNHIRSLLEDDKGDMWVGTVGGLNKLDPSSGAIQRYQEELEPSGMDPNNRYIAALLQDGDSRLWIGSLAGLFSFDFKTDSFQEHTISITNPASNRVISLYEDNDGLLWVGTLGGGLHMLDKSSGQVTGFRHKPDEPTSLGGTAVNDIQQDPFGALWFATENGLDRLSNDRERFVHYSHEPGDPESLSDNEIRSIYVDKSGILWIGTSIGGAAKYDPFKVKFAHLAADRRDPRLLSNPEVWSIFEDSRGELWIGTSAGLDRLNQRTGRVTRYSHDPEDGSSLPNNFVTDITEDQKGHIWISTYDGISIFDAGGDSFSTFYRSPDKSDPQANNRVNKLFLDQEGSLWIGTAGLGLEQLDIDTGSFTNFAYLEGDSPASSLPENTILAIFGEDNSADLWLGTMGGLVRFNRYDHSINVYNHDPLDLKSLGHDIVNAINPDSEGGLWLATGSGLDHLDFSTGEFRHFREEDGLPNNMVLGIEKDSAGRLWLSTNRGLSRFEPETGIFRNYDVNDGLQSLEFNSGAHFKSDRGNMFFGGINGINIFHPDDVFDNPYIPPVIISDFQILNQTVPVGPDSPLKQSILETDHIKLTGRDPVFSFEIASLHFGSPEENLYAYIMEGFDTGWNFIGTRRFASYTNLPPGEYIFRAIASNNDGIWNLDGSTVDIIIPFPFWQQWWFIGLAVVLLVSATLLGFSLRNRNIARRTRELEKQVDVRTAEIEQRRQIAESLREILVILNTARSLEESLNYIVTQAARLTDAEDAIIFRCPEKGPISVLATNPGGQIRYSLNEPLLELIEGWTDEALRNKEPLIIPDLPTYWFEQRYTDGTMPSSHSALLGLPLIVADDIFGGFLMFYNQVRDFDRDDLELGFTFADQAALAIANNQLREQVEETAAASERSRLARDLHDAVTQTLFSASLIAETLAPTWESDPDEGRQLIQDLRQLSRGALAEMRTLLMELRPSAIVEASLPNLLNQLSESVMGRATVVVTVHIDNFEPVPDNVQIALYRIAQEALNNVVKHAQAKTANIILQGDTNERSVALTVVDDGNGFDTANVPGHHLGLNIIRERAQAINANLSIDSGLGRGTLVSVKWHREKKDKL